MTISLITDSIKVYAVPEYAAIISSMDYEPVYSGVIYPLDPDLYENTKRTESNSAMRWKGMTLSISAAPNIPR